ncbi:MAG: peptidase S41 [Elusimicrobia bacterium CG03_land_8_20_14_0_80_50_18]|nr:MAG: peptidase S41 [Elusimicrobia bacterium CG03_land_8_20_14_0_80_50_18]PIX15097.1 MAG: peptidase S41 [Elusimicrobia bacterium CG_4_8_14_3_um_filter_50_9]
MRNFSALVLAIMIGALAWGASKTDYEELHLFNDVLSLIENNYVEEKATSELLDGAINGMIKKLDPFSQFMKPEAAELMKSETKGFFGGLGIKITIRDKWLTVITPIPGTPAFREGILPGDKIIKIDGESTEDIDVMGAVTKLRGKPGTKVTITIARDQETQDVTITREEIKIESVPKAKSRILDNGIAYIQVTEFNEKTPADFAEFYNNFEKAGMKALILDLRNNPGGLLSSAVEVSKHFLDKDQLVVYTKGRRKNSDMKFYAESTLHKKIPLVVLINHGSASGAEIVAGAVKDWGKGILLGEKSFGKGSVQSLINLSDGSELRLTTAKYYTPKGICIHEEGIEPDIHVALSREESIKLMQQSEKIYGMSEEEKAKKEKEHISDKQLDRAKEILFAEMKFSGTLPQPEVSKN